MGEWTFLTNHARVLACVARQPGIRLRDIADCSDITERAAHRIVCELEDDGYLTRHKRGARNLYEVHPDRPMRPPVEGSPVADLLDLLAGDERSTDERAA